MRVEPVVIVLAGLVVALTAIAMGVRVLPRAAQRLRGWAISKRDHRLVTAARSGLPRLKAFVARRLTPGQARGLSLTVGLAGITLCGWAFAEITDGVIERDDLAGYDRAVSAWLADHHSPWLTTTMRIATVFGSGWVTVPLVILAAVTLMPRHRRRSGMFVALATVAGTSVFVQTIKLLMARARPDLAVLTSASGYAFPSGHSAQAVAAFGVLAYLATTRLTRRVWQVVVWTLAAAVVLLVGFSRLYLGAHWLTDVLAGYLLATTWLVTVVTVTSASNRT